MAKTAWVIKNEKGKFLTVDKHGWFGWTDNDSQALGFATEGGALMLSRANDKLQEIQQHRSITEHTFEETP